MQFQFMQRVKVSSLFFALLMPFALNANAEISLGNFELPEISLPESLPTQSAPVADSDERIVTGAAIKGPIAGATISVYEVDDFGDKVGSPVTTTSTDSAGGFIVSLPSGSSMLLVESTGGAFIDESDQQADPALRRRINLSANQGFSSIIEAGQSTVAITPYTDAVVMRAINGGRLGGFHNIMASLINKTTTGFGFSIFTTIPADPVNPAAGSSTASLQYAMLQGAVANIANVSAIFMGMPQPTYDVIKAVILDMSDGSTDALHNGSSISVNGNTLPEVDFDQMLYRFRNNNYGHYAGIALPECNSCEDDLGLPVSTITYGTLEQDVGFQFGIKVRSWGKLLLNPDTGTGVLRNSLGRGGFEWAGAGDNIILDFSNNGGHIQDQFNFFRFDGTTGLQHEVIYTQFIDRIEINIVEPVRGKKTARVISTGRVEEFDTQTQQTTVTNDVGEEIVTLYDAFTLPSFADFNPAEFTEFPAFPMQVGASPTSRMDVDQLQFEPDGTGITKYGQKSFTWAVLESGLLDVNFSTGERGLYRILFTDDPDFGDFVAVDYIQEDGSLVHSGSIVVSDTGFEWDPATVPGSYIFTDRAPLNDGTEETETVWYHLYPDGTGLVEFEITDPDSGVKEIVYSGNKICWNLNVEGYLVRNRAWHPSEQERGKLPPVSFCQNLQQDQISWKRAHDPYDDPGGNPHAVVLQFFNDCGFASPGCNTFYFDSTFPVIFEAIERFSAVPPIPIDDFVSTSPDTAVTINILSNDIVGDLAIDPASVEIVTGPFEMDFSKTPYLTNDGSVTVNASTGEVTLTPDAADSADREIVFQYRVSDTSGNQSVNGRVTVSVQAGLL
jgi:hypothetical protein